MLACLPALTGCRSIGPGTVARDRSDYSSSISESWKRQTLLNIVKLRYLDPPIFVDVGQIVAGYSFETALTAGGSFPETTGFGGTTATVGGSARFTDRPTITYLPLTGNQFVKALMMPLPPESVFFMIQSGWPADGVLLAATASLNGLKNQDTSISGVTPPSPEFLRMLELFRKIQLSGAVALRVKQDAQKQSASLLTFRTDDMDDATRADIAEFRRLLRLDTDANEYELVFGSVATHNREVAVLTRSILHIMATMAAQTEVPASDVAEGRATPGIVAGDSNPRHLVRIRSSKDKPEDAAVAVAYRDHWFWIDDRDLASKRAFSFMLMLFTLADTGQKEALPLI
ncbi:MAG: hypothetical protein HC834_08205, partial [Rhodospirillales bacterium]|nr:hypothetical protein [Rhodospirillales bacterium]